MSKLQAAFSRKLTAIENRLHGRAHGVLEDIVSLKRLCLHVELFYSERISEISQGAELVFWLIIVLLRERCAQRLCLDQVVILNNVRLSVLSL